MLLTSGDNDARTVQAMVERVDVVEICWWPTIGRLCIDLFFPGHYCQPIGRVMLRLEATVCYDLGKVRFHSVGNLLTMSTMIIVYPPFSHCQC